MPGEIRATTTCSLAGQVATLTQKTGLKTQPDHLQMTTAVITLSANAADFFQNVGTEYDIIIRAKTRD